MRLANQANISMTTNRSCTLRCDHCYIEPHLFASKDKISINDYKLSFDKVDELYNFDQGLEEVEWEVMGGETTMMPFDFWQEMLPWSLDRIERFNKEHHLWINGHLNFLTNLIWADKRYLGLLKEYAKHPLFTLYTSFEPDTNRFGKNHKRLNAWSDRLASIDTNNKAVDLMLTKGLIDFGAQQVIDLLLPLGVDDLSIKMLSPFGSGKSFFDHNMTSFKKMAAFVLEIATLLPQSITFTPGVEIEHAFISGKSVQCNGNFKYDLSIEPNGDTHFNANQTGSESVGMDLNINIHNKNWAAEVMFGNREELRTKLTKHHTCCNNCVYLPRCNGGWHHYKSIDVTHLMKDGGCPGLKGVWDYFASKSNNIAFPQWNFTRREVVNG